MNNIDPAEATLAVIGMDAVISDEVEKVTGKQRRRIAKLDEEIASRVQSMIHGTLKCQFPLPPEYRKMLNKIDSTIKEDQIHKMIAPLPPEVQTGFMAKSSGVYEEIKKEFPREVFHSIAGDIVLDADDVSYFRWWWLYSVLNDPLRVINLMSIGGLLRFQADSVRENYPSISEAIDRAIDDAVPEARATNPMFNPPIEPDTGIRVWRSLPVVTGDYTAVYAKDQEQEKEQQNPPQGQLSNAAKSSSTAAMDALYTRS